MNDSLHLDLRSRFVADGFLHLEHPYGRADVRETRASVTDLTRAHDRVAVMASEILARSELIDGFLSDTLLSSLEKVLGKGFIFMPAITIRKNWYEDWHIDAAFRGALGGTSPEPDFVQCALYWQPNVPGQGGGLSVIAGTHIREMHEGRFMLDANYFNLSTFAEDVPSEAGDYVIWDGRLVHRSTAPGPEATTRLAMFMTVARASANYLGFIEHLNRRAKDDRKLGNSAEAARFDDATQLQIGKFLSDSTLTRMERFGARFAASDR